MASVPRTALPEHFSKRINGAAAWLETAGAAAGAKPVIIVGRDPTGDLLFLLPFSIRRRQGCRVLEWMGGQQMTYGYGLYDRRFLRRAGRWFATEGWSVLSADAGCRCYRPRRDAAHLGGP